MKFTSKITAALASLGLLVAASAQDQFKLNTGTAAKPAAPAAATTPAAAPAAPVAAPAAPAPKFTEAQLMEAYGYIFVLESHLGDQVQALEFTPAQKEALVRGIAMALNNQELPYDGKQIEGQLQEFVGKKQEAFVAKRDAFLTKLRMQNITDNIAFFTKLKENKNVVETHSGLRYEILKPATGAVGKVGQVATFHYTLSLVNGQTIGTSLQQNGKPIDLPLVEASQAMSGGSAGIVEALQLLGVGAKAKVYIPPSLAYGDQGNQIVPPGAALIFEVEVLGVKDAPPAPAAK
ncbi:MAG: FKBP-type peptidyl-prolyl cis-trans isomerase [Lacunisphaera sp.]|nr:FKBP-type peptidyl-prolyl cis-trans isomerase [Lacunisphaera sp.]